MPYGNAIPWLTGDQDRPGGLELQIGWDGAEAVLELVVPDAAQGAPRIAHGGFLATLADHVMGFVAAQQEGRSAVTRQMTVDYLAPTPTARQLTLRARAESVTERTVIVSLEGTLGESGQVTFRARGDYARVSPSRRHRSGTPEDYDNLEQRFDPAQIFAWLIGALTSAYRPGALLSPLVLGLDVADATPRQWTVRATGQALTIEAGAATDWDLHFAGTVQAWRELVYRRRTAEQILAAGSAAIDDPRGLLPSFLAALDT
jgi:acyl-coenzyme A thioesterase PaaI-like protein